MCKSAKIQIQTVTIIRTKISKIDEYLYIHGENAQMS